MNHNIMRRVSLYHYYCFFKGCFSCFFFGLFFYVFVRIFCNEIKIGIFLHAISHYFFCLMIRCRLMLEQIKTVKTETGTCNKVGNYSNIGKDPAPARPLVLVIVETGICTGIWMLTAPAPPPALVFKFGYWHWHRHLGTYRHLLWHWILISSLVTGNGTGTFRITGICSDTPPALMATATAILVIAITGNATASWILRF